MDLLYRLPNYTQEGLLDLAARMIEDEQGTYGGLNLTYLFPYMTPKSRLSVLSDLLSKGKDLSPLSGFLFPEAYFQLADYVKKNKVWPRGLENHIPFLPLKAVDSLLPLFRETGKVGAMDVERLLPQASMEGKDNFFEDMLEYDFARASKYAAYASVKALHEMALRYIGGFYGDCDIAKFYRYFSAEDKKKVKEKYKAYGEKTKKNKKAKK